MADAAAPKPAKKAAKPKKPANHPKYSEMIKAAITSLKERSGSSRVAILKYIQANFKDLGGETSANSHLKLALRNGVKNGSLKQVKGTGASGSFKVGKEEVKKPKKVVKKKPAAKKEKKAKKPAAKKEKKAKTPKKAAKKPKSPKKAAKKPAAKKAAKKPAAKKAAKPKKPAAKKSPKKKAAKKPAKK